jgi:hypothetical protein
MKYTWTKDNYEGKKFDKVLVLTLSKNLKSRTLFENTVADLLKAEGINATNGINVITPVEDVKKLSEEEIEKRIVDGGYDAVLVTTLIDVNTRDVQVITTTIIHICMVVIMVTATVVLYIQTTTICTIRNTAKKKHMC